VALNPSWNHPGGDRRAGHAPGWPCPGTGGHQLLARGGQLPDSPDRGPAAHRGRRCDRAADVRPRRGGQRGAQRSGRHAGTVGRFAAAARDHGPVSIPRDASSTASVTSPAPPAGRPPPGCRHGHARHRHRRARNYASSKTGPQTPARLARDRAGRASLPTMGGEWPGRPTLAAAHRSAGSLRSADQARCDRRLQAVTGGQAKSCSAARSRCCSVCRGAAPSRSGSMYSLPRVGSSGPGLARHCARGRDPRPRPGSPAVTATYQRGKQAWPLRPVMPALGRRGGPPGRRRPYGLVRAARRPRGTAGWSEVTDGTGFWTENPPHRYRVGTLAGRAHQPAQSVPRPARSDRPGPVVRLPERGRIRESGLAPRHGAPGGRNPDPVTNDTVPGDRNRMKQRIESHRRLQGFTITVSPDADARRLSYPASPAGHARPPGVPRETS
jgi:hypothetical protein